MLKATFFLRSLIPLFVFVVFLASGSFHQLSAAALTYGSGTYTNLCGTGLAATADTCTAGCNTSVGSCYSTNHFVTKFTCSGRVTECRSNEQPFSTSYTLANTACGKTVQIDVFNKNCRANGDWSCNQNSDLKDYIVWYSGDCSTPTPTPTPTPSPSASPSPSPIIVCDPPWANNPNYCQNRCGVTTSCNQTKNCGSCTTPTPTPSPTPSYYSSCDSLKILSGDNSLVPASITFRTTGADNHGAIQNYRYSFGDGTSQTSITQEVTHQYTTSGTFSVRSEIQDSFGNWKSSSNCSNSVIVKPSNIESHKSGCSDLYFTLSNSGRAPSSAQLEVSAYDNKGSIQAYKIELGNGEVKENSSRFFDYTYNTAGTYTVKAFMKDSQGNWKGGSDNCQKSLQVLSTQVMKKQPKTGTPAILSISAIISVLAGVGLQYAKKKLAHK